MKKRIVCGFFVVFFLLGGLPLPANADLRSGVDCNCSKTGEYKNPTAGSAPKSGVLPEFVAQSDGTFDSPGGQYTLEITDDGTTTYLRVFPAAAAGAIYSTNLLTNSIALDSDAFQTPGGHNIKAGFSPDDDRFVYHYLDTGGIYHVKLIDLANGGSVVKAYDLGVTGSSLAFSPKGAQLLFTWSTASDIFFRVSNAVSGDDVFTETTTPDFDPGTTPWGFSPDGNRLVYHYVSNASGSQRHYVRLYTLSAPTAAQAAAFDTAISFADPRTGASLRFSPKSGFLIYAADGLVANQTLLQVRDTTDGRVVWQETFNYTPNPGEKGDKFKGATWGFSNDAKNLNLLYAVDTSLSQFSVNLVNLATGQRVRQENAVDIVSGFWQFSPCGDKLALVAQGSSGQLSITLYETVDGTVAYSNSVASTVAVAFASTATDHWVTVGNGAPQSMIANSADGSCDTSAPLWPAGARISADSKTETGVTLSWPAATDAANYLLFRDGGPEAETTETGATVDGLSPGTTYRFKVEAEDAAGNRTSDGPSLSVTTLADTTPPEWPASAAATANGVGGYWLNIAWDAATDASGYVVLLDGEQVATTDANTRQYYTEGLAEGTAYTFKIEAEDAAGNRTSDGPSVTVTTQDNTDPTWPQDAVLEVSATAADGTSLTLSWTAAGDNVGVDHYALYMDNQLLSDTIPAETTTYTVQGLELGNSYNFTIEAVDAAGNDSWGPRLNEANTDALAPEWGDASLRVDAAGVTRLTVSWGAAADNVGVYQYELYVDGILIDDYIPATRHTYTVDCLMPGTEHTVRVEARDRAKNTSTTGPRLTAATLAGSVSTEFGETALEPLAPEGAAANDASQVGDVSSDGRFLVFTSGATNLVEGDTNGYNDVFLKDRQLGTIERVSIATDGTQPNYHSGSTHVSDDGRFVIFHTFADNLIAGYRDAVFLRDRLTRTTLPAAVDRFGGPPNAGTSARDLSADGRKVLFASSATDIVAGDTNGTSDLFLRALDTDETVMVSVSQSGVQADNHTFFGDMSRDGRFVVMESAATNLVDGETNARGGIYFKDMLTGAVELIAADVSYTPSTPYRDYLQPVVSDDGRFVAYTLNAIDPGWMVFLHDRQTGVTRRVDQTPYGSAGASSNPVITPDGRYVAFESYDGALAEDTNDDKDVLLFDRVTDRLERISVCTGGGQVNGDSGGHHITSDGGTAFFGSGAPNVLWLPTDTNGVSDIFVRTRGQQAPPDPDSDGDGLTDAEERDTHQTDPDRPDTDGDGLSDGDEVNTHRTDPLSVDSDQDGLLDGDEVERGTDPMASDTDGDGMADGWEADHGLDPLIDDADGDLDADGKTNIFEYQNGRLPDNAEPAAPQLLQPEDLATDVALGPQLVVGDFSDSDGDTHGATHWQVGTSADDFTAGALVLDIRSEKHRVALGVPEFILNANSVYYWRVKFHDQDGNASEWSAVFSFTTVTANSLDGNNDGTPDDQEVTDENVDMDADGTPDANQAGIRVVAAADGRMLALKAGANVAAVDALMVLDPSAIDDTANRPENLPEGLLSFRLRVNAPGDIATVTVYLSNPAPAGARWFKYDVIGGWQDYSAHAVFSSDRSTVTLEFKDGGFGDGDGAENAVIVDPSGVGVGASASPPQAASGGAGCFIATAAFGSPLEPHVQLLRDFRDRFMRDNRIGRTLLRGYYRHSPPVAAVIENYRGLKAAVRAALLPVIGMAWAALRIGLVPVLALTLLAAFFVFGVACRGRRASRRSKA